MVQITVPFIRIGIVGIVSGIDRYKDSCQTVIPVITVDEWVILGYNIMGVIHSPGRIPTAALHQAVMKFGCAVIIVNILSINYAPDRKSTRLNSSHVAISYAVFSLIKNKQ